MFRRLRALIAKEFIQMRRDRLTLAMMLMLPLIQLAVFGFAINTDVKHVPMAVLDRSLDRHSRELIQAFTNSEYFDVVATVTRESDLADMIDRGTVKVGLVIPPDYANHLSRGLPAKVQVVVDATDPIIASSALSNSQGVANYLSLPILYRHLEAGTAYRLPDMPVSMEIRAWYNPDLVTSHYIVPGLIGVILTMTMMMITSMAIVKERETGTLEQLITTPLRPVELMIGKIVPYMVVGYVQVTIALLVGVLVFGVPIRGSLVALYSMAFFYIFCYLGLGLLISTVARSQQQAMQMSFFIFLPTILLSGFMFPRAGMPVAARYLGLVIPLTYFLEILRGIILKGVGLGMLIRFIVPMVILMTLFFSLAVLRFQRRAD
ncbi:MAG: ABC transporter permease [Vulcanimicrobiota bacterium]